MPICIILFASTHFNGTGERMPSKAENNSTEHSSSIGPSHSDPYITATLIQRLEFELPQGA